jgi:S1-C subfamily serine protease
MKNLINRVVLLLAILTIFISVKKVKFNANPQEDIAPHVVPFKVAIMQSRNYATGFHLEYEDKVYILTNRHVCDMHLRVYRHKHIQFGDYVGEIIKIDDLHDLCLVTSNRKEGLKLANIESKPLDKVYLVGFPRGMDRVIREGRIIGEEKIFAPWLDGQTVDTLFISTIAYGGNSGSPVTNEQGDVTGVLFAGSPLYHTEAYVVPLSYIKLFLRMYAK